MRWVSPHYDSIEIKAKPTLHAFPAVQTLGLSIAEEARLVFIAPTLQAARAAGDKTDTTIDRLPASALA